MSIEVKDFDLTETKTVSKININVLQLELNKFCRLSYQLFDSDNIPVKTGIIELKDEEYEAWGASDSYVTDYVLNSLGLTKK